VSAKRRSDANAERSTRRKQGPPRAERLFYVAVEGESTEPDYLIYLNKEFGAEGKFVIKPLYERNGMKPREVVAKVVAAGDDDGERWALFDRDEHTGIPEAFTAAASAGVKVAFSHPSFDLWLLLHMSDFSGSQSGSSSIVHEKLRRNPAFRTFGINGRNKELRGERLDALRGNEQVATKRARRLVGDCPTPECTSKHGHVSHCAEMNRDPSTDVWRLLVALGVVTD
jgi:hypothetical protein